MWEIAKNFKVKIGGNYFIDCGCLISYDDECLFTIKRRESDGRIGIDFDVYDESGKKVATIRNSNVVDGDPKAYEISHEATCKKVVEKSTGRLIVQVDKDPPDADLAVTARLHMPGTGFLLEATPDSINIGTSRMINCTMRNCRTGIALGSSSGGAGFKFDAPT